MVFIISTYLVFNTSKLSYKEKSEKIKTVKFSIKNSTK